MPLIPMAAVAMLRVKSPTAPFQYLSGASAGLKSRWMWARVKAEAERDLIAQFDAVCWRTAMMGTPTTPPPLVLKVLRGEAAPTARSAAYLISCTCFTHAATSGCIGPFAPA